MEGSSQENDGGAIARKGSHVKDGRAITGEGWRGHHRIRMEGSSQGKDGGAITRE